MSLIDGTETARCRAATSTTDGSANVFDVFAETSESATIVMADVLGNGARTRGYRHYLRSAVRAFADDQSPARVLDRVNASFIRHVPHSGEDDRRAAMFLASLRGHVLTYASAGHDSAMLVGTKGHRHLPRTGRHIGIDDRTHYGQTRLIVESDEWLVVVTDGVTGARNGTGRPFGTRGVAESAVSAIAALLDDPAAVILDAARTHASGRLVEDASVLCFRLR